METNRTAVDQLLNSRTAVAARSVNFAATKTHTAIVGFTLATYRTYQPSSLVNRPSVKLLNMLLVVFLAYRLQYIDKDILNDKEGS